MISVRFGSILGRTLHVLFLFTMSGIAVEFQDLTTDIYENGQYLGVIAAFGDFNSDKLTDTFYIKEQRTLEVLLANENKPYLRSSGIICMMTNAITSVMPADFNGDSMMDIMITIQKREKEEFMNEVKVLWGFYDHVNCASNTSFTVFGQPLVVDYNGDMIPDLMGDGEDKQRYVWLASKRKNFTKVPVKSQMPLQPFRIPHSSSVLDLNNDLASDIVITGQNNIEQWLNEGENFTFGKYLDYPEGASVCGQSTFVDFNSDGKLDHIMPICNDVNCKSSVIKLMDERTLNWTTVLDKFVFENATWGFRPLTGNVLEKASLPVTLRAGDFDMDGYPDFVVVLQNSKSETKAVILHNIPCPECPLGRSLQIQWQVPGLSNIPNVQIGAFYDIFEDGRMDILVASNTDGMWKMHALQNIGAYDACFIKVLVLSGLCYTDCPANHIPYGTNQPGPMIRYNTTKPNGEPQISCAVQMSQSAHFPLQLPYSVFGLGQTPNFVDSLTIAIPKVTNNKVQKHEWTQIIPNSQMVVIPHPPQNYQKWVNKLFVTPSHLVLMTFIALVGTCGFIAVVVGVLHWRERREDRREKMQDAYRFHFDAM